MAMSGIFSESKSCAITKFITMVCLTPIIWDMGPYKEMVKSIQPWHPWDFTSQRPARAAYHKFHVSGFLVLVGCMSCVSWMYVLITCVCVFLLFVIRKLVYNW